MQQPPRCTPIPAGSRTRGRRSGLALRQFGCQPALQAVGERAESEPTGHVGEAAVHILPLRKQAALTGLVTATLLLGCSSTTSWDRPKSATCKAGERTKHGRSGCGSLAAAGLLAAGAGPHHPPLPIAAPRLARPVGIHQQVGALEVTMHDGRRAGVQVQHAGGRVQRLQGEGSQGSAHHGPSAGSQPQLPGACRLLLTAAVKHSSRVRTMRRRRCHVSCAAAAGSRRPSASTSVRLPLLQYSVTRQGGSRHTPTGERAGEGRRGGVVVLAQRRVACAGQAARAAPQSRPARSRKETMLGWRSAAIRPASPSSLAATPLLRCRACATSASLVRLLPLPPSKILMAIGVSCQVPK